MKIQYAMNMARIRGRLDRILCLLNERRQLRTVSSLAILVALLSGCNGGTVDRHALQRDAEHVGSLATEGSLLAHDVSTGDSTKIFARVHAKELSRAASDLEDALAERPTSAGITADVRKLSRLAGKVSDELERLHLHPTDRAIAESLEQPLRIDADAADELAK
jgi:hypothetical protein